MLQSLLQYHIRINLMQVRGYIKNLVSLVQQDDENTDSLGGVLEHLSHPAQRIERKQNLSFISLYVGAKQH